MTDENAAAAVASKAFRDAEPGLRLLGAVGEIALGVDPDAPSEGSWWAQCTASNGGPPRTVKAHGFPSPKAALDDLRRQLSEPDTGLVLG